MSAKRKEKQYGFVHTATINGVEALPVTVEVSVSNGLPGTYIVGMADTAVSEARFRVRLALRAAGFDVPNKCIVINLAPSSVKKIGSGLDLPIALGILIASEQIPPELVEGRLCIGELSIDGTLRSVAGQLAYEKLAFDSGLALLTAPTVRGVYSAERHQHQCLYSLADLHCGEMYEVGSREHNQEQSHADYRDVAGNEYVKRALQIAAAGKHPIFLLGPPGSGKSMLASRLPTILPELREDERIESAMIYSVAGLPYDEILRGKQPFRAPHHSASRAGLLGGGTPPGPGEVTLAHNGVLFLDEMPEFGSSVLQMLRQPIESGYVSLARANKTLIFPARFLLVGAANPCPCGYYSDEQRVCKCSEAQVLNYQSRIGGPLMDRFDMVIHVRRSDPALVLATGKGMSSEIMRKRVSDARDFRDERERFSGNQLSSQDMLHGDNYDLNALDSALDSALDNDFRKQVDAVGFINNDKQTLGVGAKILASCMLSDTQISFLEKVATKYQLSGRGIMRALSVARTIADLEMSMQVSNEHLLEAIGFRFENGGF
jgi:magnesium chelatase family protein